MANKPKIVQFCHVYDPEWESDTQTRVLLDNGEIWGQELTKDSDGIIETGEWQIWGCAMPPHVQGYPGDD